MRYDTMECAGVTSVGLTSTCQTCSQCKYHIKLPTSTSRQYICLKNTKYNNENCLKKEIKPFSCLELANDIQNIKYFTCDNIIF